MDSGVVRQQTQYLMTNEMKIPMPTSHTNDVLPDQPIDVGAFNSMSTDMTSDDLRPCPCCGKLTNSLKQYNYAVWWIIFGYAIYTTEAFYRACPTCIRKTIWKRCLLNAIPANFFWLIGLFPWAICLTIASFRAGHSADVIDGITPAMAMAREKQRVQFSSNRVLAVMAVLTCWTPLAGLVFGILSHWANRYAVDWKRPVSKICLVGTSLIQVIWVIIAISRT